MKYKYSLLLVLLMLTSVFSQNQEEDRKKIDAVVAKLYHSISFINSEGANHEMLKSIHHADAKVGVVDTAQIRLFPEKEFREKNKEAFAKNNIISFVEKEIGSTTHVYGGVATRFSTYEFVVKSATRERKVRGVNAIQLIKDPTKGWLIYSTFFSDEISYPEVPKIYWNP